MPKPIQTDYITIRGRAMYAKVLGAPMDNYDKDGKEWKIDIVIDDKKDLARLKALGVSDRVKQKEDYLDGAPHMTVRQKAEGRNGPNDSPEVTDILGKAWDQKVMIGNDSVIDIKLRIADYGKGFKKGIYINGIRVLDLVPYVRNAFDEIDKNDPYYQKANAAAAAAEAGGEDQEYANTRRSQKANSNADAADEDAEEEPFD